MKRIILILGLAASMGLTGTGSVHAQFVVHDPGHTLLNSTEWIANVKKWVTQINEMIDAQELRLGLQKIDQLKELKSLKELADLCTGPITDEEFEDCRRGLLSGMNGVEDSLGGIESWYYIEVLRAGANSAAPIQSPEQARSALRAVTKDEVRDILRRLTLSVSYLLTKEDTAHAAE